MLLFPQKPESSQIDILIEEIRALCKALESMPVSDQRKNAIFHKQYLKSSLFSARIEGNTLTLSQISEEQVLSPREKKKREIGNILKALRSLPKWEAPLFFPQVQEMHSYILDGIDTKNGSFRQEQSAIFDQTGAAVYVTPDPVTMKEMLTTLLSKWNEPKNNREWLGSVGQFHYYFEKIHPFIDGNGRVGRILLHLLLTKAGLEKGMVLPIDAYIDNNREAYYSYLEKNSTDVVEFTRFLLEGVVWSLHSIFDDIKMSGDGIDPSLLPRRSEIVQIITDHPYASLDLIARRFPNIPRRTIAYDVSWLVQKKMVTKFGETRGVRYSVSEK